MRNDLLYLNARFQFQINDYVSIEDIETLVNEFPKYLDKLPKPNDLDDLKLDDELKFYGIEIFLFQKPIFLFKLLGLFCLK